MKESDIQNLRFSKKPISIPADYRPIYKIAQIVLILKLTGTAGKASLLKLHLLNWAMKNDKNKDEIIHFIRSNYLSEITVWGIEPAMNRALLLCIAEGICSIENGKYKLEEKGNDFYKLLYNDSELFLEEKEFLTFVGKRHITDARIDSISQKWTLFNVKN